MTAVYFHSFFSITKMFLLGVTSADVLGLRYIVTQHLSSGYGYNPLLGVVRLTQSSEEVGERAGALLTEQPRAEPCEAPGRNP